MEESLNRKFAALADPTRRAILARLAQGEASVAELGVPFRMSQPAISKHLKVLETAGLIEAGQAAKVRPRRLKRDAISEPAKWLEMLGGDWEAKFDRLDAYLAKLDEGETKMTDAHTTPVFMIQRRFAAPIERVFDAWADPKKMEQWSGPIGSQVTVLSGGIAPGETLHSHYRAADGAAMHNLVRYHEVNRPRRLVYDQSFADADANIVKAPFFDVWPHVMRTDVDFAEDDGGTRVTLRWTPVDASADEEAMFASMMESMTGGWTGSFDRLDEFLAG